MSLEIDVEEAGWAELAGLEELAATACAAVFAAQGKRPDDYDVSLVFSSDEAVRALNAAWRGKDNATNVLSFPAEDMPLPRGEPHPLGDSRGVWLKNPDGVPVQLVAAERTAPPALKRQTSRLPARSRAWKQPSWLPM